MTRRDDYRPAWALPRYGVRAALRAWATAAVLVGLAWALARAAAGQDGPPASVPLVGYGGRVTCRAARYDGGAYSARHCEGPRLLDGQTAPYSADPTRDLLHFAAMPAAGVGLRPAVVGERLTWRNDRAGGTVTVLRTGEAGGLFAFFYADGDMANFGESGSGLYGDDGALVGVLSLLGCLPDHTVTGAGWAVQVP